MAAPTDGARRQAIVARLIPSDRNGPGALEAGAALYIDRALGGALASALSAYRSGLAALDRHAHVERGDRLAALDPSHQDDLLAALESDDIPGFGAAGASGSAFFAMLRTHTIEGTFCDPAYGGNTRDRARCLRIYYFWGADSQEVVVASMPAHARTSLT